MRVCASMPPTKAKAKAKAKKRKKRKKRKKVDTIQQYAGTLAHNNAVFLTSRRPAPLQ